MTENNNINKSDNSKFTDVSEMISAATVSAIQDKKGTGITILDMSGIPTAPASKFIICEGKSTSQVSAIADNIREELRINLDKKPYNYDGYRNSQWIVIDYGELIVHVFIKDARQLYNLEELWSDALITQIPDLD